MYGAAFAVEVVCWFVGCKVLAYDVFVNEEFKQKPEVQYVTLDELFKQADIVSLHAPLTEETTHMVNSRTLSLMKPNAMIINTSRGKLIDSKALLDALLAGKIAGAGLDVYENEKEYFFNDHSGGLIGDSILSRFQNMNGVVVTSHQAFLTDEALSNIADCTLFNVQEFLSGKKMDQMTNYVKLG